MSLVPFYQLTNGTNFLLTADTAYRATLESEGWVDLISPTSNIYQNASDYPGSVALYMVFTTAGGVFYTASTSLLATLVADGWINNGVAGYVTTSQPTNWGPLNWAVNDQTGLYLFTASASQWNTLGASWSKSPTPACYVPNPHS